MSYTVDTDFESYYTNTRDVDIVDDESDTFFDDVNYTEDFEPIDYLDY